MTIASVCVLAVVPYYRWGLEPTESVTMAIKLLNERQAPASTAPAQRSKFQIVLSTLPLALSVWTTMCLTFVVIPGQVTKWKTDHPEKYPGGAFGYQDMHIYVFQGFDAVGRLLVTAGLDLSPTAVIVWSAVRIVLLPFFFLATAKWRLFGNSLVRFVLGAFFATSYGILLSLGMIHGPDQVSQAEADIAGYTMSFFMENGVIFGALIALAMEAIPSAYSQVTTLRRECAIDPVGLTLVCTEL